jgi:hypothetical protein
MKSNSIKTHLFGYALFLAIILTFSTVTFSQDKSVKKKQVREFCTDDWSNDDKVSFSEIREMTLRPTSLLDVDAGQNGGIRVKGENRSDILVRACVRTWGETDEAAKTLARNIRITGDSVIRTEGVSGEKSWAVSYEILVPRATNLKLETFNGGISISGVDGNIEFGAMNGGVSLSDVAGSVKGKTTNGGVSVTLSGNSWKGNGLDVETTNGGVHLVMPETYAARIETRTVNGGFISDISSLNVERDENDRRRGVNFSRDINGGGALIRVVTTNGGVKISSASKSL